MRRSESKKRFWLVTGRDLFLVTAVTALACAGLLFRIIAPTHAGEWVRVVSPGAEGIYALAQDGEYLIAGKDGMLRLEIRAGGARVTASDCPDHLCIAGGVLRHRGQILACLPLGIVMTIEGGDGHDVIAY